MTSRGTMHAPKTDGTRRRRNKPAYDATTLVRDGRRRGPTLKIATGHTWGPDVTRWYETWRRSPQAAIFEDTDWARLALLAPIVEAYYAAQRRECTYCGGGTVANLTRLLAEIRMNEERLGATVVDRMRAQMKITEPAEAELAALPAARQDIAARLTG